MARSTRCRLSRTAASGSPTRMVLGMAVGETSTSTSTLPASMPNSEIIREQNSFASNLLAKYLVLQLEVLDDQFLLLAYLLEEYSNAQMQRLKKKWVRCARG